MTNRPNKYYIKLLLFGFIVSTIPVVTVGLFSYLKSSGVVRH